MNVFDQARIIIYRIHDKGLEILLVPSEEGRNDWLLPYSEFSKKYPNWTKDEKSIELDPIIDEHGNQIPAFAIEADWHEIPSVKGLIKKDIQFVRHKLENKIEKILPEVEKGAYTTLKETFKKVLPQEYAYLKELKDIIFDRNMVRNI